MLQSWQVCVCVCLLQVIRRYSDFDVLNNSLMVSSSHELHDSEWSITVFQRLTRYVDRFIDVWAVWTLNSLCCSHERRGNDTLGDIT